MGNSLKPGAYLVQRKRIPRPGEPPQGASGPAPSHGLPPGVHGNTYVGHRAVFAHVARGGRVKVSGRG